MFPNQRMGGDTRDDHHRPHDNSRRRGRDDHPQQQRDDGGSTGGGGKRKRDRKGHNSRRKRSRSRSGSQESRNNSNNNRMGGNHNERGRGRGAERWDKLRAEHPHNGALFQDGTKPENVRRMLANSTTILTEYGLQRAKRAKRNEPSNDEACEVNSSNNTTTGTFPASNKQIASSGGDNNDNGSAPENPKENAGVKNSSSADIQSSSRTRREDSNHQYELEWPLKVNARTPYDYWTCVNCITENLPLSTRCTKCGSVFNDKKKFAFNDSILKEFFPRTKRDDEWTSASDFCHSLASQLWIDDTDYTIGREDVEAALAPFRPAHVPPLFTKHMSFADCPISFKKRSGCASIQLPSVNDALQLMVNLQEFNNLSVKREREEQQKVEEKGGEPAKAVAGKFSSALEQFGIKHGEQQRRCGMESVVFIKHRDGYDAAVAAPQPILDSAAVGSAPGVWKAHRIGIGFNGGNTRCKVFKSIKAADEKDEAKAVAAAAVGAASTTDSKDPRLPFNPHWETLDDLEKIMTPLWNEKVSTGKASRAELSFYNNNSGTLMKLKQEKVLRDQEELSRQQQQQQIASGASPTTDGGEVKDNNNSSSVAAKLAALRAKRAAAAAATATTTPGGAKDDLPSSTTSAQAPATFPPQSGATAVSNQLGTTALTINQPSSSSSVPAPTTPTMTTSKETLQEALARKKRELQEKKQRQQQQEAESAAVLALGNNSSFVSVAAVPKAPAFFSDPKTEGRKIEIHPMAIPDPVKRWVDDVMVEIVSAKQREKEGYHQS